MVAIRLENTFVLAMAPDQAFALLNDVERIAPHLPGAKLTEIAGEDHHGTVSVKLGPITAQYKGTATITGRDAAARRLTLTGKGRDIRGQGTASADLVARVLPEGSGSRVNVTTELQVTGKVAQLGRGIMQDVSARLIEQFVANLAQAEGGTISSTPTPDPDNRTNTAAPIQASSVTEMPVASTSPRSIDAPDPAPIDLLKVGGGAILSREVFVGAWMFAVLVLLAIIAVR